MRKLAFCVFLAVFGSAGAVFAQANKTSSDYYPVRVYIEKIYPYRLGYVVSYRVGQSIKEAYLPLEWFARTETKELGLPPKAEMTLLRGGMAPYMSVYYRRGNDSDNPKPEFDHVRVYAPRNYQDPHWGVIRQEVNLDERFKGVETLDIAFKLRDNSSKSQN